MPHRCPDLPKERRSGPVAGDTWLMIRRATEADLEAMLALAEAKRAQYAEYQPKFHRPAPNAREMQRPYFQRLIHDENAIVLVAENGAVDGFVIAQTGPAPPVYDPGGLTMVIDDFMVRSSALWTTVGRSLLDHVRAMVRERGAVQIIVVCGPTDGPKRRMLQVAGLGAASEWFVASVERENHVESSRKAEDEGGNHDHHPLKH